LLPGFFPPAFGWGLSFGLEILVGHDLDHSDQEFAEPAEDGQETLHQLGEE
jgi:hypothetical protein